MRKITTTSSKIKKFFSALVDIGFVVSLTLLAKFENVDPLLDKYQLVFTFFWMCGFIKFAHQIDDAKESMLDFLKDFLISIIAIPLWYWISDSIEVEIFEPISTCGHFLSLLILLWCMKPLAALGGRTVYHINAFVPVIILVLVRLGVSVNVAVVIAAVAGCATTIVFCRAKRRKVAEQKEMKHTKKKHGRKKK